MLTNRQVALIRLLAEADREGYLTTEQMAKKMQLSPRTIQTEMSAIREELGKVQFLELESVRSKGYKLTVFNAEQFLTYLKSTHNEGELNTRENRLKKIIAILFDSCRAITAMRLADKLYVSRSTLASDLNEVKKMLKKYHISIQTTSHDGIFVSGEEADIRRCIFKEGIYVENSHDQVSDDENIKRISKYLVDTFSDYKYSVSDVALQNLVVHFNIILRRVRTGFGLTQKIGIDEEAYDLEIRMARDFFAKMQRHFGRSFSEAEILNAAVCFRGKRDYYEDIYITEEVDSFVQGALETIRDDFGLDFLYDMQLRISLSLHLVPLLSRIKYNGQLVNDLLVTIRQQFQLAFDMASSFAFSITNHYGYSLTESEVSYLALYFEIAINDYKRRKSGKKVLIISDLKRSQSLLLRDRIYYWFESQIGKLDIYDSLRVRDVDPDSYDLILTTIREYHELDDRTILIHRYPDEADRRLIKMNFDGFNGVDGFIDFFDQKNFFVTDCEEKEEILKLLCACSPQERKLYEAVCRREKIGGTYFGNGMAVPHPLHPVEDRTAIYVAVQNKSIVWNEEGDKARVIFLVSMQKDNLMSLNVWAYLSELINQQSFVESVAKTTGYEAFARLLRQTLRNTRFEDHEDFF